MFYILLVEPLSELNFKVKGKRERPQPLATNQVEQFYCQLLGQEKGISTATQLKQYYEICS